MKFSTLNKKSTTISLACLASMLLIVVTSCEKDYLVREPIPVQKVPVQTATLEAAYVTSVPSTINSSYWNEADYHNVTLANLNTQNIYTDGLLNMSGTYNGLSDFNSELTLKAAYDNNKLYILAEWSDPTSDASQSSWLWDGPADPLKSDVTDGWTSQRGNDKLSFAFEIDNASSSAGTFSNVGCAASCHNNAMQPQTGTVDIWNWSLGLSEPMGYAADMVTDNTSGLTKDGGQGLYTRNNSGTTDRSGPAYEWDGVAQTITKGDGSSATLDPAYFLLNKTAFIGDPDAGSTVYLHSSKGCGHCHGDDGGGEGIAGDAPAFIKPSRNRLSRAAFENYAGSSTHTGQYYFNQLNPTEKVNLITRIRGFAGVPGYYLTSPSGSSADIVTNSNVLIAKVSASNTTYKVLFIRELNTGNVDDAQFTPPIKTSYKFGVALMNNDKDNHIGSLVETLIFKQQ